jgi:hypothetical protein
MGDLISLLSFLESRLKMYQSVQKLKRGTDETGTQDGDLIRLLPVLESRLKRYQSLC